MGGAQQVVTRSFRGSPAQPPPLSRLALPPSSAESRGGRGGRVGLSSSSSGASRAVRVLARLSSQRVESGDVFPSSSSSHRHVPGQREKNLGLLLMGKECSLLDNSRGSWICPLNQTEFSIFAKMDPDNVFFLFVFRRVKRRYFP